MIEDLDDLTLVYIYGARNGRDSMKDYIERMRDALRRIAHAPHGKVYCADGHEEAVLIARAALAGEAFDDAAT
jgi:plasmid stabilization system protein ParE